MSSWFADLVYSTRALRRRGRFTATAVIVLTLGIGASIAVFSFVNAMLVRPLPYHEPDRLTLLWSTAGQSMQLPVTWPDFEGWRGQVPSLESLAALDIGEVTLASDTHAGAIGGAPEQVIAARVSPATCCSRADSNGSANWRSAWRWAAAARASCGCSSPKASCSRS